MKPPLPATLIQVHYHNRDGGVTTVMKAYARAFANLHADKSAKNIFWCHKHRGAAVPESVSIISAPDCEYEWFFSKTAFVRAEQKLLERLKTLITANLKNGPVCCIAHNMTLGKNMALATAFSGCAALFARTRADVRFISVVHDLAEAGRLECLQQIRRNAAWDKNFYEALFPRLNNTVYVTPGNDVYTILKNRGLSVYLLENPLDLPSAGPLSAPEKNRRRRLCARRALKTDARLNPELPFAFYPVRAIARKNVLEAVLAASLAGSMNLIVGKCGTHPADKKTYARLRRFCRRHHIPILFDYQKIEKQTDNYARTCDYFISTSLAEGFGFALYMPWLYDKPLVGRKPADFATGRRALNFTMLYEELLVPSSWVNGKALVKKYQEFLGRMEYSRAEINRFCGQLNERFDKRKWIDFGLLDQTSQFKILKRLVCRPTDLEFVFVRLKNCLIPIADYLARARQFPVYKINRNRRYCRKHLGFDSFRHRFSRLLQMPLSKCKTSRKAGRCVRLALKPSHIRLLLTPGM